MPTNSHRFKRQPNASIFTLSVYISFLLFILLHGVLNNTPSERVSINHRAPISGYISRVPI